MPDLSGELAVVTGAGGRLGRAWVRCLRGAGADVVGLDVKPPEADEPAGPAGRYRPIAADVTDRASLRAALDEVLAAAGTPTVVVNNAGIDQPPSGMARSWLFSDIPDEVSAAVLDVNTLGALRMSQVFGAELARAGRGSIVNIGSLYGRLAPDPRLYDHLPMDPPFLKPPSYAMSKAGLGALTRYLAALWGPVGVRVNTLSPGGVAGGQDDRFVAKFTDRVPMRRMAVLDDLAGPLLFLASSASSYVTGHDLVVDGGYGCW